MVRVSFLFALGAAAWVGFRGCSAIFVESPKGEPPQYCTVFHHFPKSGGTSVKNRLIEESRIDHSLKPGLVTGMKRTTAEKRLSIIANSSVIMGYVEMFRLPLEDAGRECDFFTMLRNPIDRLVSAFYFCPTDKEIPDNRPEKWCGGAKNQTESLQDRLLEFATERWRNTAFRLMMHSFVCDPGFELCHPELMSSPRTWPYNINTPEGLKMMDSVKVGHGGPPGRILRKGGAPLPLYTAKALQKILATYTAVGILEEWELSMQLFDAKVKSPVQQWNTTVAANQAGRSPERQALLAWANESQELKDMLAADVLFYEFAVAVFRQQTSATLNTHWD